MDRFGEFAEELKTAAKSTSRDSDEYKEIISMLEGFNKKGVDFSAASSKVAAVKFCHKKLLFTSHLDKIYTHFVKNMSERSTIVVLKTLKRCINHY